MATESSNVQRAGHKGEAAWASALEKWLPPQYEIATRKYLVLETDLHGSSRSAETDILIFQPSYPRSLRNREEVLASGVVAAFSVRLTLDRSGIEEAAREAAQVRRSMKIRQATAVGELIPPLLYGILAHSHAWQKNNSTPDANIETIVSEFDREHSNSPREGLDLICVADLNCWSRASIILGSDLGSESEQVATGMGPAFSDHIISPPPKIDVKTLPRYRLPPIAALITELMTKLSYFDASVLPIAEGLRVTNTRGSGVAPLRKLPWSEVFSEDAQREIRNRNNASAWFF